MQNCDMRQFTHPPHTPTPNQCHSTHPPHTPTHLPDPTANPCMSPHTPTHLPYHTANPCHSTHLPYPTANSCHSTSPHIYLTPQRIHVTPHTHTSTRAHSELMSLPHSHLTSPHLTSPPSAAVLAFNLVHPTLANLHISSEDTQSTASTTLLCPYN
ncbi:hypothetical protein Pcinc_030785 [Petrolisthes cinctipes]|uniref:Uncharacterized protein n=1 Tax=Petrolisthes cinctipes TaxID=88211 RepID=A0AAE1EXE8_PETCI|nr:hypothetical protein Pcinc_030785 [Petrolisthes cinctipes]